MLDQSACSHGLTFDRDEADQILRDTKEDGSLDPSVAFVLGPINATYKIRERFPRGWFTAEAPCPFCGYVGIAYVSADHYAYGDW